MSKQSRRKSKRHRGAKPAPPNPPRRLWPPFDVYHYMSLDRVPPERKAPNSATPRRSDAEWAKFASRVQESARLHVLGLEARHLPGKQDIGIYNEDNHRVATVLDNRARVESRTWVAGDFLGDGEHWDHLHALLAEASPAEERAPEFRAIPNEQVTTAVPPSASRDSRERAERASETIREHFHGLACPVELAGDQFTTTFWPTNKYNKITGVPFEYRPRHGSPIYGRLCLFQRRHHKIIPIAASPAVDRNALYTARLLALSELALLISQQRDEDTRPPLGKTSGDRERAVSRAFVRPHIRRLPEGQHATHKAIVNAELRGVELQDGETFVTDHVRHGKDRLMRVAGWNASIDLNDLADEQARAA